MKTTCLSFLGLGCVLFLLATAGCESFKGASESYLTSVSITNRPMADVNAAVTNVFLGHAFTGGPTATNRFTFKRAGGGVDNLAYGSYLFQHPISVKVEVTTRQSAADTIIVGCNAWVIEAEYDQIFEEVHPVRSFRKGPYAELLGEIKKYLGQ